MKRERLAFIFALLIIPAIQTAVIGAEESSAKDSGDKAAEAGAENPSAVDVLKRFSKAIGGEEAFQKHTSQHATGTVEMRGQNLKGKMEVFAARPDKLKMIVSMEGIGTITTAFDGTNGWLVNPLIGPMLLEGKMLDQVKSEADFDHTLHNPEDYKTIELQGKETFNGELCYKLHLVHKSGFDSIEYFSVKTGLQKGFIATQDSPFGPVKATTQVSDYKHFGDLYVPSKMTQSVSGVETVMTITEMEFDNVAKDTFDPPAAIKALLESKKEGSQYAPEKSAKKAPSATEKKP